MPRRQFNVRAIYTRVCTPRPRHALRYRKSGIHSWEITPSISMDREFYYGRYGRCLVCIDYRMHAYCENRRYPGVLKRVAHVCEGRMMLGVTTRARSLHVDFCQGYVAYAYVYPDPSSAIVSIAVKQRNLGAEIIGSAFSICSKLNRLRDGRAKNASTRLSSSIEWIAWSTSRTRSRFDERVGVFGKMRVLRAKTGIIKMQQKFKRVEFHWEFL